MSSSAVRVTLLALAAALATGCQSDGGRRATADAAPAPAVPPPAEPVSPPAEPAPPAPTAYETALAPLHDVDILARVDGEIVGLDAEEGERVAAGARLAQIDEREQRALLAEREAGLTRAESAWTRAQRLHEQRLIAEEVFVTARADMEVARAQRDRARIEWERCAVRAPIRGVVALRRAQIGQTVKEGDLLFRVGDPDTLRAELLLPESRLGTVRAGQAVRIEPLAGGPPTVARVTRVSPLVDPASGTFRVVIDLDNRAGRLRAGVSARVVLEAPAAPR